ncbi:hypothetical protein JOB18_037288 [Solea senegalensis]|uniref:Uncharacterized protein n=1 Tax=Solea senegalensis TaxID=28829 RepID=A0AAV6SLJ1_SOLSE|nr:hypothetical protein JOB18_037288 [Solea senegalensis]
MWSPGTSLSVRGQRRGTMSSSSVPPARREAGGSASQHILPETPVVRMDGVCVWSHEWPDCLWLLIG